MTPDEYWYRNALIYSLDVETFMDANGDGVGDFAGLQSKIDYLERLGVDAIWLAPFQPSPHRDNGYDVSDHYGVDHRLGSAGDFVEFMHLAAERGIRVLMDLVVNHTSDQHRWFQEARSDAGSRYRDWYVWSEERPEGWDEGMVFPGVQESTWSHDETAGLWYFHRFFDFQPDLNFDNPRVRAEVHRIIGYWIRLGIAGFRLDAVPFIIESPLGGTPERTRNFDYLDELSRVMRWRRGDAVFLGEANVPPENDERYFGPRADRMHMMFNFFANQHLFLTLATGDARPLTDAVCATRSVPRHAQWCQFLRNHDELDLGRLDEEQRQLCFQRFAPDPTMQLYGRGIRRRLAPMLGSRALEELAYSIMFSLPGTPVLRYGDEIGMGDDLRLDERDAVRTPMQWNAQQNGGFSTAPPEKLVHPVVSGGEYGFESVNVEAQRRDPDSLLNWMTNLIRIRKECEEIGRGTWSLLETGSHQVIAMQYNWRDESIIVLHNVGPDHAHTSISIDASPGTRLVDLMLEEESRTRKDATARFQLQGFGYRWLRLGATDRPHIHHDR